MADKYKLGPSAGKHKLGAKAGKYKLGVRAGKSKLETRAGGQVKERGPGNAKNLSATINKGLFLLTSYVVLVYDFE